MVASCSLCKRKEAVYMRPYSGEKLCGKCFTKSIENKVRATIAKYNMLRHDDKIMVAVSGGKDSISLLHILAKIEKGFPKASLIAVTVDEGIRGYRDEALKFAVENSQKLGIEHFTVTFKEMYGFRLDELVGMLQSKEKTLTPCAYCGVLRRRALNMAARKAGTNKLATAHNLDDETQTIILNILHGDALRIARVNPLMDSSHPDLIPRIKPLCEIPEKETAFYAYLKKIKFQTVPCPYAHAALRNDVRVMLNRIEEKHAGTKYTIFRSIEKIRPMLETMAVMEKLKECKLCGEPTTGDICKPCQLLQELRII
ncbi:MAG: TIGR00269 family protein [Candidatus Bathyarchaeia archaeon]